MIRKLLMVAAAAAVPMSAIAVGVVGASTSGAATPPFSGPPITCTFSGTVNFSAPGLSVSGNITPNKTSTTTVTGISYSGCTGGTGAAGPFNQLNGLSIVSKNTKCTKSGTPVGSQTCFKPNRVENSLSGLATSGPTLAKSIKHELFGIQGFTFKNKPTATAFPAPGSIVGASSCPSEVGFAVAGTVKSKPKSTYTTYVLTACLGADTGPGTTGSFANDVTNSSAQIQTATIDASAGESSITIGT